jgi:hypothetical protein
MATSFGKCKTTWGIAMSIINIPPDIFDLLLINIIRDIDVRDIIQYYKQLLCLKLSCTTFFGYLKYINYLDIARYYFEKTNLIYVNYLNFIDQGFSHKLCGNPNCYDDSEDFFTDAEYPNTRYIHFHQFASPCSHYCTYCKMSYFNS